jgi:hypothetical protein
MQSDSWGCQELSDRRFPAVVRCAFWALMALPKVGIKGNTHFPFSDLNNIEVADHLLAWLKEKRLD